MKATGQDGMRDVIRVGILAAILAFPAIGAEAQMQKGASGLPLPRFVSIKSPRVNIRVGPSVDHNIAWTFVQAGVPVEVTQEYDIWFRIRDSEGQEGWVQKTMLSGTRTAYVAPWLKTGNVAMHARTDSAAAMAMLEPHVLVTVLDCDGKACRINAHGYKGYVDQDKLWGVYPAEKVD
jgi:SH3-like domain-containing protein